MIVYLSGPITNMPDLNRPAFARAEKALATSGYTVVNPFDVCPNPASWSDAMRRDIRALTHCDAIAMLPGWENLRGAKLEKHIAEQFGMKPIFITQDAA